MLYLLKKEQNKEENNIDRKNGIITRYIGNKKTVVFEKLKGIINNDNFKILNNANIKKNCKIYKQPNLN